MNYIISGRNIDVTEGLKQAVIDKLDKIERFCDSFSNVHVTMSVQRANQRVEISVYCNGKLVKVEKETSDMYASINEAVLALEKQLKDGHTKRESKIKKYRKDLYNHGKAKFDMSEVEEIGYQPEKNKDIETVSIPMKPMNVEEAILQMNMLNYQFFVFLNDDTRHVNVVHKIGNNSYKLIEPEGL